VENNAHRAGAVGAGADALFDVPAYGDHVVRTEAGTQRRAGAGDGNGVVLGEDDARRVFHEPRRQDRQPMVGRAVDVDDVEPFRPQQGAQCAQGSGKLVEARRIVLRMRRDAGHLRGERVQGAGGRRRHGDAELPRQARGQPGDIDRVSADVRAGVEIRVEDLHGRGRRGGPSPTIRAAACRSAVRPLTNPSARAARRPALPGGQGRWSMLRAAQKHILETRTNAQSARFPRFVRPPRPGGRRRGPGRDPVLPGAGRRAGHRLPHQAAALRGAVPARRPARFHRPPAGRESARLAGPAHHRREPFRGGRQQRRRPGGAAAPDGYTLVMGAVATHAINPWLFANLPYDPIKDFAPVTIVAAVPNVLVMNVDFAKKNGIESLADLIAYAKKNPDRLNYGSGGNGSAGHLAGELLKARAGIKAVHIPYQGASPAQLALLGGQSDFMFDNLASAAPLIKDGKVKALAVTTLQRSSLLADVPTMDEAGVKGFDLGTWFGVFTTGGTPAAVVAKLNKAYADALRQPDVRQRLLAMGSEAEPMTPEAFAAFVKNEKNKYQEVVKLSGASLN